MPIDSAPTSRLPHRPRSGVLALPLVLATPGLAQPQFEELVKRYLPADADPSFAVAARDFDGDGDPDVWIGNRGQSRLYLNRGFAIFTDATSTHVPSAARNTMDLAAADVDGDGDLDLILANDGQSSLYSNDGAGVFTDATAASLPSELDRTLAAVLADVDGDGDADLVLGNDGAQNRLLLNDGRGAFGDATPARLPADADATQSVAAGDVNGDGALDLVFGNHGQNRLYLNDGAGSFADATPLRLPVESAPTNAVALGDVDRDGDLDLVCANRGQNRLYTNDGTGVFADATGFLPADNDDTTAVRLSDVDGDGTLDLVLATSQALPGASQNRLYVNDGVGRFRDETPTRMPADGDWSAAVASGDLDQDGDPDLVFANASSQQTRVYLNDSAGAFANVSAGRMPLDLDFTRDLALGDVDGDGDVDMVIANSFVRYYAYYFGSALGWDNRLYLNDGTGAFNPAAAGRMPTDSDPSEAVALGDVDGDGDLDLIFGNGDDAYGRGVGQPNRLYLNDGAGTFADVSPTRLPSDRDVTSSVVCGDVDGDGDIDLLFGNGGGIYGAGQPNRLYLNDGTGTFTDATAGRLPPDRDRTVALALGDVDGDGDPDLIAGNRGDRDRLYLNDGSGTFVDATAERLPGRQENTAALALGDVDGDGDSDLIVGNGPDRCGPYGAYACFRRDRLYLNDGTGHFVDATAGRMPAVLDATFDIGLGDVDGDGDRDLVMANGGANRLYLNDGTGRFGDASARLPPAPAFSRFEDVALGDVDGDGDRDLVFGDPGGRNVILTNLRRQLDAPLLAISGGELRLDGYARGGGLQVALPYAATAAARIALPPLGILGLEPALMIPLPAFAISAATGAGSLRVRVPSHPGLVGLPLFAQALLVAWPAGPVLLTNVTADRILR